ncbi:MAG TPA: LysM peptidoglycan-binding domain-containing protein [Clostridiales bacterium]|nr:LysM peptidoglycan-binding domain-containing protein [Clostridiales bacterium]
MYTKDTAILKPVRRRKTLKVVSRFRLCLFITIILLIIITIFSFFLLKGKAQDMPDYFVSWNVNKGDTLWTIAKVYLPKGRDIRDYIMEIQEWNEMDTPNIIEGQQLSIPVYDSSSRIKTAAVYD